MGENAIGELILDLCFFAIREIMKDRCGAYGYWPILVIVSLFATMVSACLKTKIFLLCQTSIFPFYNVPVLIMGVVTFSASWTCIEENFRWVGYVCHLIIIMLLVGCNVLLIIHKSRQKRKIANNKKNKKKTNSRKALLKSKRKPDLDNVSGSEVPNTQNQGDYNRLEDEEEV
ncbi:unnamed protein product [Moneuplotes crassus]|uniref:Uncharacterized protein n=1 Tax=Euplotes crassus TaxID=5936 RepID=A0AAD1XJQ0_EUPCR|nr:unnamed protein product [Moneuplotes crassus]